MQVVATETERQVFEALVQFLKVFVVVSAFVVGIAFAKALRLRRLARIMSYSSFRTPCELRDEFVRIYRPFIHPNVPAFREMLEFGEEKKIFVGRDSSRCACSREYCLAANIRRRRRSRTMRAWWDPVLNPA